MGLKWYAWVFAVVTVFACGVLLPVEQINTLASSMQTAFELPPLLLAAGIAVPLALIIFGGIKRIASFAAMAVPFMAVAYLLFSLEIGRASCRERACRLGEFSVGPGLFKKKT